MGPAKGWRHTTTMFAAVLVMFFLHVSTDASSDWQTATGTWYGDAEGDGSTGGACGYGNLVQSADFKGKTTAASPAIYQSGEGCGACFQVKCNGQNALCGNSVRTVIVTDECPGCQGVHFDLSGSAFGALALDGKQSELRNAGRIQIQYRKVDCNFGQRKLSFQVNQGSSNYWFSVLTLFADGDGEVGSLKLRQSGSSQWMQMSRLWGANWALTTGPLSPPFSLQVTLADSSETLTANDVIPAGFQPSATYTSKVNFHSDAAPVNSVPAVALQSDDLDEIVSDKSDKSGDDDDDDDDDEDDDDDDEDDDERYIAFLSNRKSDKRE